MERGQDSFVVAESAESADDLDQEGATMACAIAMDPTARLLASIAYQRDDRAWATLIARHGAAMRRCAAAAAGADLADDAVQDALLSVRCQARTFVPRGSPAEAEAAARRWLLRIAANCALNLARRERRVRRRAAAAPSVRGALVESEPAIDREDEAALLRRSVARLPEHHRLPIALYFFAGLDYPSLAGELGCSPAGARVRLHRALARLRQGLPTALTVNDRPQTMLAAIAVNAASACNNAERSTSGHRWPSVSPRSAAWSSVSTIAAIAAAIVAITVIASAYAGLGFGANDNATTHPHVARPAAVRAVAASIACEYDVAAILPLYNRLDARSLALGDPRPDSLSLRRRQRAFAAFAAELEDRLPNAACVAFDDARSGWLRVDAPPELQHSVDRLLLDLRESARHPSPLDYQSPIRSAAAFLDADGDPSLPAIAQ